MFGNDPKLTFQCKIPLSASIFGWRHGRPMRCWIVPRQLTDLRQFYILKCVALIM